MFGAKAGRLQPLGDSKGEAVCSTGHQTNCRSKRTCELTSSIVSRGTSPLRLINELLQRFLSTALFSSLSFQFDLPLPMSRTHRGLLPMEELHVREQFARYIDSVPCNPFFSGSRHGMVVSWRPNVDAALTPVWSGWIVENSIYCQS